MPADGIVLARRLVERFPERCFWGTDWPHPNHHHVPDDGVLVDALAQIAPTPAALEALLPNYTQYWQLPFGLIVILIVV